MSMRIGSSMPSFYNAAGRVNFTNQNAKVNSVEKVDAAKEAQGVNSLSEQGTLSSQSNRGIIQTKVSPENSYQKAMVTDPSFAYDRMAAKLMDKLPRILEDMKNLSEEDSSLTTAAGSTAANASETTASKVVISEDGSMKGQSAAVNPVPEDISL